MPTKKLVRLLGEMDLPIQRQSSLNKNNLEWLHKHLHYKNSDHKYYKPAIQEINRRLEHKEYDN